MKKRGIILLIAVPLLLVAAGAVGVYYAMQPARVAPTFELQQDGATGASLARGIELFEAEQHDDAKAYFEQQLEQYPGETEALYYLGRIAMHFRDGAQAAALLEQCVEAEPGNAEYQYQLGNAYGVQAMAGGNPLAAMTLGAKVRTYYDKAVELDPDHLEAHQGLAMWHLFVPAIAGGSKDTARMHAAKVKELEPYDGSMLEAMIAQQTGDPDAAIATYRSLIEQDPMRPDPYPLLARALQEQDRADEGVEICRTFIALGSEGSRGYYELGRIAAITGTHLDEGRDALNAYMGYEPTERDPDHAAAHWRIGQIEEHAGDTDAARAAYEAALELRPDMDEAKQALAKLNG